MDTNNTLKLLDILGKNGVTWSLSWHTGPNLEAHYRVALFWGKDNKENIEASGNTPEEALIEALAQLAYIVSRGLHR